MKASPDISWPKISLVTPTYNMGRFLERCIRSILSQNYPNLEYIIIDGGSTDNTAEVIKKYEEHITYWVSEPDEGQSNAINKGYRVATGDVINWLNADDELCEGALLEVGKAFQNPETNMFTGVTVILHEKDGTKELNRGVYFPDDPEKTVSRPFLHQPSTYLRRQNVLEVGLLNEQLHFAMDIELFIRYEMRFGIAGLVDSLKEISVFRVHEDSKTGQHHDIFVQDIAAIYYSMAIQNGYSKLADKIELIADGKQLKNYTFEFDFSKTTLDIECILQNYIYKYVVIYYQEDSTDISKAQKLVEGLDLPKLNKEDLGVYQKIKSRLKLYTFVKPIKQLKKLLKP